MNAAFGCRGLRDLVMISNDAQPSPPDLRVTNGHFSSCAVHSRIDVGRHTHMCSYFLVVSPDGICSRFFTGLSLIHATAAVLDHRCHIRRAGRLTE
jgi:hypothetical protein